jgi:hypothetical protein
MNLKISPSISNRTIDIEEFVPKADIDPRYLIRPLSRARRQVGHDAFAVIRETIRSMDMIAVGRLVLTSREHIIGLEPQKNGLIGSLLRFPYDVRSEDEYFDDIQDVKATKDRRGYCGITVTIFLSTVPPWLDELRTESRGLPSSAARAGGRRLQFDGEHMLGGDDGLRPDQAAAL